MKIFVTVKQVPDTTGKVSVKADGTLDRASMETVTNPDDLNAVEAALQLKEQTGATSGNLSVQIDKLTTAQYITAEKGFKGKLPCTTCKITQTGQEAFARYVDALQAYLVTSK